MKTPLKFSALLASAAILTSSALSAATTDPVGYVTISGNSGGYIITTPMLKSSVFQSETNAVGTDVLSFDSSVPSLTGAHFVQVMSGSLAGTIVDIVSTTSNSITLSSQLPVADGDMISVRPHFKIEDLGLDFTGGSSVTVYNSDGSRSTATYQDNFLGTGWFGESSAPIYPGEGFVLISTGEFNIVNTGEVSTNPVFYSGSAGVVNIVGALSPLGVNAADLFSNLPPQSTVSVYQKGTTLTNPTVYSKAPAFLGGQWSGDLSEIEFGSDVAVVVIPSSDSPIPIPAVPTY